MNAGEVLVFVLSMLGLFALQDLLWDCLPNTWQDRLTWVGAAGCLTVIMGIIIGVMVGLVWLLRPLLR